MSWSVRGFENANEAYQRVREVCRFLNSLPEVKNMPILIFLNFDGDNIPNYNLP